MIIDRWLCAVGVLMAGSLLTSATELEEAICLKSGTFLAPLESSEHRKYAPDREFDIVHLTIDATPDFNRRTVAATVTLRLKPIIKPLAVLRLDAVDLQVRSVTSTQAVQGFHQTDQKLVIPFAAPLPPDQETTVVIQYTAEPAKGLYFRTPEMGYKPGDTHLFTQGEAIEARHWYPSFDAPNEKFTSEMICHVPQGMIALSNGKLVSQQTNAASGLVTFRWLQEKPHVNYLISLVAGYFKKIEDRYKDIPMAFYTPPSEIAQAENSFRETKEAMAFFEEEIGIPYPWAKYDQVCVNDFVAGGMENTSITTLTDGTLFTRETENIHSSRGLMAHELAHQWFGDLVTCKDWSQLWLNEGFATYYDFLFEGKSQGRDAMLYRLYEESNQITRRARDTKSIVYRAYDSPMDQFSYLVYPKGAWVLHMLRSQLGDDLYRRGVKLYLERHAYGSVVTEDLRSIFEEISGRSLDQFFDQWVYHAHHPELDIRYSWDSVARTAKISVSQNQQLSPEVLLFRFPLPIRFHTKDGVIDREIEVKEKSEDFSFALPSAPDLVRIDPNLTLLAKIQFESSDAMLEQQLKSDVIGRLLAVEQLGRKRSQRAVDLLKQALQEDAFFGVRIEAAQALASIHSDEAFAALSKSLNQPDARVRLEVARSIGKFYGNEAFDLAKTQLAQEKNPEISAQWIRSAGAYGKTEVAALIRSHVEKPSYRQTLALGAVQAMRAQDDPVYVSTIALLLTNRTSQFSSRGISTLLSTLAYLARNNEDKTAVRELISSHVESKNRTIRLGALSALGTLADPKSAALLERFATAGTETPERRPAETALNAVRSAKKPADELRDLRNEILSLQKSNRQIQDELNALKKKIDPLTSTSTSATNTAPARKKTGPARKANPFKR